MAFREDEIHGKHYPLRRRLATFIFTFIVVIAILYLFFFLLKKGAFLSSVLVLVLLLILVPLLVFEVDKILWKGD